MIRLSLEVALKIAISENQLRFRAVDCHEVRRSATRNWLCKSDATGKFYFQHPVNQ